jgi:hypothetical protein
LEEEEEVVVVVVWVQGTMKLREMKEEEVWVVWMKWRGKEKEAPKGWEV